jgi:hypothetical protein
MRVYLNAHAAPPIFETPFAMESPMRKLMAALIASLIGLIALSVTTTAVACGDSSYSNGK